MGLFDGMFGDFPNDVVSGFTGTDYLKDYTHASKLVRPDAFALAPNTKFLFHVYFSLNVPSTSNDKGLVGALVKSVQLPSFQLDTQEYVQYNRKRNIHNRIKYQPVTIKMHDDASDTVRSMWHNYYSYYFADTDYQYDDPNANTGAGGPGYAYLGRNIYNGKYDNTEWGMTTKKSEGQIKPAFFKDIKIFGFSRGNYILYTLINPMIDSWTHDTYDYAAGDGTMEHTMTVRYEAVKYGRGKIAEGVPGFGVEAPQRYDTSPGPLSKSGSTASIFGQSGLLDSATGAFEDLSSGNILGAIKKIGTQVRTFDNADLSFGEILKDDVLKEGARQLPSVLKTLGTKTGILMPKASSKKVEGKPSGPYAPTPFNGGANG